MHKIKIKQAAGQKSINKVVPKDEVIIVRKTQQDIISRKINKVLIIN